MRTERPHHSLSHKKKKKKKEEALDVGSLPRRASDAKRNRRRGQI